MFALYLIIAVALGAAVGYFIRSQIMAGRVGSAEQKATQMLEEAKRQEKEILLDAKSRALEITDQAKKAEEDFRQQISRFEDRIDRKEKDLERQQSEIAVAKKDIEEKKLESEILLQEAKEAKGKQLATLEKIAGLTKEEAGRVLMEHAEKGIGEDMIHLHRKLIAQAKEDADKEAARIVAQAIERIASDVTAETTTTTVAIPSEEMKGRIIGKEGRNIRAFESLMGVEILIDDSPDTVVVSGFNSIRRHIGARTLERLIQDGRIHPAKIEEAYEKCKAEINEEIRKAGEDAVFELGITNFPPKLVHLVGRLRFRTSYGQNILRHSVEMAKLAASMAEELKADISIVKQGALLHDIGKALDQDMEGTHVEIGRRIAEKFGLSPAVVEAIESHHHDTDVSETATHKHLDDLSLEAMIVDAADSISGSRPGARKDSTENYIKRLAELEAVANSYEEVDRSWVFGGGRQLWVFVSPSKVNDAAAQKLARDLAGRIESELKYPGEIRVVVIRETRVVEYAR